MIFPDYNPTNFSASMVLDHLATLRSEINDVKKEEILKSVDYYNNLQLSYMDGYGFNTEEVPLQTMNITEKVIKKISLLYKDAPDRNNDNYLKWTQYSKDHKQFDVSLTEAERYKNLLGSVLYRPFYIKDLGWRFFIDYEFISHYHDEDSLTPVAYTIPIKHDVGNTDTSTIREDWHIFVSDQHFFWFSQSDTKKVEYFKWAPKGEHKLGINPAVLLRKKFPVDQNSNGPANDLIESNESINRALNDLNMSIHLQAFDQPYGSGISEDQVKLIKLGPTNLPVVPEEAELKLLGYDPKIIDTVDSIKFQVEAINRAYNINTDWSMSGTPSSGFALTVKNIDLMEAREDDIPIVEAQEQNIYDVIVAQQKLFKIPKEPKLKEGESLSIAFREIDLPVSESEEREKWDWEIKNNANNIINYMISKYGMDVKTAKKELADNKEINEELTPVARAINAALDVGIEEGQNGSTEL